MLIWLCPDSKVDGANMGPIWGRQDPGGPHFGPMNFAIWVVILRDSDIMWQLLNEWWNPLKLQKGKLIWKPLYNH